MKTLIGLILMLLAIPAMAATLKWDAVTTDISGAPDVIVNYKCYSRQSGTSNPFVLLGTATGTSFPLPSASARQEYVVTAVDAAGNESDPSNTATAKPNAPGNATVIK